MAFVPKILVKTYPKEFHPFIKFIRKLYRINEWEDIGKLRITLDYQAKDVVGYYLPNDRDKIYINPSNCIHRHHTEFSESVVLIHEYSHLLDSHFKMISEWCDFEPVIINQNSKKNRIEELAEHLSVYLIDRKLYWKLSRKRFNFFKKYVKSPKISGIELPKTLFDGCSEHIKNQCVR